MNRIVCVMCEALTDEWVAWYSTCVEEVYLFCTNTCLRGWLDRQLVEEKLDAWDWC
jgi:hypothetical protein